MNKKRYKTPMAKFHELAIDGTMVNLNVASGGDGSLQDSRSGGYQQNEDNVTEATWGHQF